VILLIYNITSMKKMNGAENEKKINKRHDSNGAHDIGDYNNLSS
jgi:hypothetical protein